MRCKALKEAGVWTAAAQAHNDALVKRQGVLVAAWDAYTKASPPDDKDAFYKGWIAKRKAALVGLAWTRSSSEPHARRRRCSA